MINKYATWSWKEKERYLLFVSCIVMANAFFYLHLPSKMKTSLRNFGEDCLLDPRLEVKLAAKRLLSALFLIEDVQQQVRDGEFNIYSSKCTKREIPPDATGSPAKGPAGSPLKAPTPGSPTKVAENTPGIQKTDFQAVQCLTILLYVAQDMGTPKEITGAVIEMLAPYGNQRFYQSKIYKEVQSSFQEFLKRQQSSSHAWKECQKKLTPKQRDLIDAYKGHLSYFS